MCIINSPISIDDNGAVRRASNNSYRCQIKAVICIGVIGSLGERGDWQAVSDLRPLLSSGDPKTVAPLG